MRKKASRGTGLHIERLDQRRLYAGNTLTINGTSGEDEIYVVMYNNYVQVSNNDVVTNYASNSVSGIVINGGNSDDDLEVSNAVNQPVTINGGSGNDIVFGGAGNDSLVGGDGQDYIRGKNGNDYIDAGAGGAGVQLSYGDNGNDTIYGGVNDDKMYGGLGSDNLYGAQGTNTYCGNDGDNNDDGAVDYFYHTYSETYGAVYGQSNDQNIWPGY